MKSIATICFCVGLSLSVFGKQDSLQQRIGIIGSVPILIETNHAVYDLGEDSVFEIAPGRIRISIPPRGTPFNFDHLFRKKDVKALPIERAEKVAILYSFGEKSNRKWLPLIYSKKRNAGQTADLTVQQGDRLSIAWREGENGTVQEYVRFKAVERVPEIIGYRLHSNYDSSRKPGALERKVLHTYNDRSGYSELDGFSLHIPPGGMPEFRIKTYRYLTDEVIGYRLITSDSVAGNWIKTGHVLALPYLVGDETYQLEMKFPGQKLTSKYVLVVAIHWYEQLWVKMSALTVLLALTILLTAWVYRRKLAREKDNRTRIEDQLRTLQSRLNPHFIFNALSSIESLIASGQTKEANHYLSMFSDILRQTLEHSGEISISLSEDIALLDRYLRIEQLRFGFQYAINTDPAVETTTLEVPPMLMQPLVENAVKHGVAGMGAMGLIEVNIQADDFNLSITITDNGSGTETEIKTAGGHGIRFTRQRLSEYAKLNPLQPIELSINHTSSGTVVKLLYTNLMG